MTTDFETDLRQRLGEAADSAGASPELLPTIERRIATRGRRAAAIRVAAVVAVLGLSAGGAVVLASGDRTEGEPNIATEPTDDALDPDDPATTAPTTPGWAVMADAPISGRAGHLTLAMDDEVLVWGGWATATAAQGDAPGLRDGAVYDTTTDTWRTIPPGPGMTSMALGVWTGEVAIVVSGSEQGGGGPRTAAAFDPATDTWTALDTPPDGTTANAVAHATWTGTQVILVTGGASTGGQVAVYDVATDSWSEGNQPDTPLPVFAQVAWTGSELAVVGLDTGIGDQPYSVNGDLDGDGDLLDPGDPPPVADSPTVGQTVVHLYEPVGDTWRSIPWGLGPSRRTPVVVWTGQALFVGGGGREADAALLDPATGTWTPLPPAPSPFASSGRGPTLFTGDRVLIPTTATTGSEDVPGPLRVLAFDVVAGTWSEGPAAPVEAPQAVEPVWSAGRVVAPLGGLPTPEEEGVTFCCDHGPTGGITYVP